MSKRIIWLAIFCLLLLSPFCLRAYTITQLPNVGNYNDFVLEGGKKELNLDPGQSAKSSVVVINRSGQPLNFSVTVEDFQGTDGANLDFLGTAKGQYSLKDFLHPEVASFSLLHGERIELPVTVKIPADAPPGGLYGAVLVSAVPVNAAASAAGEGQVKTVSRLAALYFVRVSGAVNEAGELVSLAPAKVINQQSPVKIYFTFKNDGNIYLDPSATVTLLNILGQPKENLQVPAYFVMPGTTRTQAVEFKQPKFGWYRVKLSLNPGYGAKNIERTASFWLLPAWTAAAAIFVIVIIIIGLIILVRRRRK